MSIKEELFEQYLLSESKPDFLRSLVPESQEHMYFQVLHSLNTKNNLSDDDIKLLNKLKNTYSSKLTKLKMKYSGNTNDNYILHNLEFQHLLRTLDSPKSSATQKEQAIEDLKNYFNIQFNAVKPHNIPQSPQSSGQETPQYNDLTPQLESVLDQKFINFQSYLDQAYSSTHHMSRIIPQALYKVDVNKLLNEYKKSNKPASLLEMFLSSVPCLHQVKDVPKIYKVLYDDYKNRKQIYDFSQEGYDRLSTDQLQELGKLMKDVVFETKEYQLALIKKLFFKDISKCLNKDNTILTQQEKSEKKKQYGEILVWAKKKLPKKFQHLQRLLNQEIVILSVELGEQVQKDVFLEFAQNPPTEIITYNASFREQFIKNSPLQDDIWNQVFTFTNLNNAKLLKLIETCLTVYFRGAENIKPYNSVFDEQFLHKVFYQSKIQSGQQEYISRASLVLSKKEIDTLIDSREITILENNNRYVEGNEEVQLLVQTKNIQNMTLNIFEINTENYYLQKKTQFDNTISLEGLIPFHTSDFTFTEPSNQVVMRQFSLQPIQHASQGYFIVEFFGNSISSRAVFKKGLLAIVETPTIAGHLITIVDECSNICKPTDSGRTGIWLNDRFHSALNDGHILIPYSDSSQLVQAVLVHNDYSELEQFQVLTEQYNFECSFIYNQESFLQGSKAKIIIRPTLSINNLPANMAVIEEQLIKVTIKNHLDIPTAIEFKDIKFDDNKDIEIEIPIQSILKEINIECSGLINKMNSTKQNITKNKTITFHTHQYPSGQIYNLYLKQNDKKDYIVYTLDKSGLPFKKVPIEFQIFHKNIQDPFTIRLQTDYEGQVILGKLENIYQISADVKDYKDFPDIHSSWNIMSQSSKVELPSEITIIEDEYIQIPLPKEVVLNRENLTFYSINTTHSSEFVYDDLFDRLQFEGGFLTISQLKQGTYVLHILELQTHITIRVYQGKYWSHNSQFLIANNTFIAVERQNDKLVTIKETLLIPQTENGSDIFIKLNLPSSITESQRKNLRVHIFAFNFLSCEQDSFIHSLRNSRAQKNQTHVNLKHTPANFFNNKKIGEEICYVYNRKVEQKRIGNTLEKPCVLLKRTFNRDTTFEAEKLEKGQDYSSVSLSKMQERQLKYDVQRELCMEQERLYCRREYQDVHEILISKGEIDTFLNFLNVPSFVSSNNQVSEDGSIRVSGFQQNNYSNIQVVVTSPNVAVSDIFSISSQKQLTQDLRHQSSMKSDQLYTESLSSGVLHSTQSLQISADSSTAVVSNIPQLFEIQKQIMKTGKSSDVYKNLNYSHWQFLKEWNTLTDKQKLEKYNEFACHEINIFLYFKDLKFFKVVVEPFLKNKIQKTFIDFFLLDEKEEIQNYSVTERLNELNILEQSLLILALVKNNQHQKAEQIANSIENIQKTQPKNIELKKRLFLTIIESSAKDEIKVASEQSRSLDSNSRAPPILGGVPSASPLLYCGIEQGEKTPKRLLREHTKLESNRDGDCLEDGKISDKTLLDSRKEFKEGYKKLEKTVEYIERQYYGDNQTNNYVNIVKVNKFWSDLVRHIINNNGIENFVTENFIFAFNNHVEAISVLALMDIPFTSRDNFDLNSLPQRKIQVLAKKNIVYFSKEINQSSEIIKANVNIIQAFFDPSDRYTTLKDDPSIQIEKEVKEFIINKIYGCKVIITNTSISNLNLQVLTEIPEGSIPVNSFEYTKSIDISVNSYQTHNQIEFFFYFPKIGQFSMYRSNASRNGIIVAQAEEIPHIGVKPIHSTKQMENLSDILNNGSKQDILKFAKNQNLHDTQAFNIQKILHIIQSDKQFFLDFLDILREQSIFNRNVWEYSFLHNYEKGILECINNKEFRINRMADSYTQIQSYSANYLKFENFSIFEYHPLLTSRVHSFMDQNKSKILNVQFKQTYNDYVKYLSHISNPTSSQYLVLCYYLILQERIDDVLQVFGKIKETDLSSSGKIQYDYFAAYLDIYTGAPHFKRARELSQAYIEYPIISWRNLFVNLQNQLAEFDGELLDESEIAQNTDLSKNLKGGERESSVYFEISGKQIVLYYQNADRADINLYKLDIEVLFSTQPFMQKGDKNEFTYIKPNDTIKVTFERNNKLEKKIIDIPPAYSNKNLNIQLVSPAGIQNTQYFSSDLKIQMIEKYGQVKVVDESNIPLQKVYVKCFAKLKNDTVSFFRDGYTDLRGRFDYALSSSNDINQVKEFSILICSEENGSVVREAKPPTTSGRMESTINLLSKKK